MSVLQRFEQRLETLVTGAFARVFKSAVQPVEVAAALQREMDNSAQILSRERRLAPNDFTVELADSDHDRLSPYGETLCAEMTTMLKAHADEQHYVFAGPVTVRFTAADDLSTGRFRVRSAALASVTPAPGQRAAEATVHAQAVLEVNGVRHPLDPPGVVIGRGAEADLRVDDPGVSRRHAEIRVQQDGNYLQVSVLDLGSTNGISVNGRRVQQAVLDDGNEVTLGSTKLILRRLRPIGGPPPGTPPPATGPR